MGLGAILSLITIPIVGYLIYRFFIKSLITKWKYNKHLWFDLLAGIVIAFTALGALAYIFIQQLP